MEGVIYIFFGINWKEHTFVKYKAPSMFTENLG